MTIAAIFVLAFQATDASTGDTISDLLVLVQKHAWVPIAALVINFIVRQLKSDAKLPFNVSPRWRAMAAAFLGVVSGVLQAIVTGTKPADAIIGGLLSSSMAVFAHETISTALLNGKNFMPAAGKKKDGGGSPPPTGGATVGLVMFVVVFVAGCGGNFEEARSAHVAFGAAAPVRDQTHCNSLDSDHTLFIRGAWASGTLAAGAGITAGALSGNNSTETTWRQGLAITAAVGGAMAVASTIEANNAAQNWAADCSGADPIPAPVPIPAASP